MILSILSQSNKYLGVHRQRSNGVSDREGEPVKGMEQKVENWS